MVLVSPKEVLDLIIMTVAVGIIFMPARQAGIIDADVLDVHTKSDEWKQRLWFSILIAAPGIILHELGHKFVAIGFGLEAVFHAAYTWLGIGLVLKFMNAGFVFLVPGYVSIQGLSSPIQHLLIAFAGPGINGLLYLIAHYILRTKKKMKTNEFLFWTVTKRINGFLFIFNMLPIPGFDGWSFWRSLLILISVI